jgi:hypothetical protein
LLAAEKPYAAFTKDGVETPCWLASVLRQQLLARRAPVYRDEAEAIATACEQRHPKLESLAPICVSPAAGSLKLNLPFLTAHIYAY